MMADAPNPEVLACESRKLRDMFQEIIAPHRQPLWQYCLRLTGSPWDAEDLFQETLMKAYATLPQLWSPFVPKSYLFRIATNSWIDSCRKKRLPLGELEEESIADIQPQDPLEIRDAIMTMITQLVPKQLVVILLMDVFEFTADDVASMLHCSRGSVYAALRRARERLQGLRSEGMNGEAGKQTITHRQLKAIEPDSTAVNSIIRALNTGNVNEFLAVMSDQIHNDAAPGFQEFSKQEVRKQSGQGLPSGLRASYHELWGRKVILVLANTESGPALHNIAYPVVDGDNISYLRGYYFCKELLMEVGERLGIPVQMDKMPPNWDKV